MDKSRLLFVLVLVAAVAVLLFTINAYQENNQKTDQEQVGFEFDVKMESKTQGATAAHWKIIIILPKESYSRENLERLFRFYSLKYSNKKEWLQVIVYTDIKNLVDPETPGYIPSHPRDEEVLPERTPSGTERRFASFDAIFWRQSDIPNQGEENEWYTYSPNLDKPNELKTIVMKGRDPYK